MKNIIISLVIIFIFSACKKDEQTMDKTNSQASFVTEQTAFLVSNNFRNEIKPSRTATSTEKNIFSINKDSQPIMYVINYKEGGFTIISAENRIEPILAFSEEGEFAKENTKYPEGLKTWINHFGEIISYVRTNNIACPPEISAIWNNYTKTPSTDSRAATPSDDVCEGLDELRITVGPFLSTEWHQEDPFNASLPMIEKENGSFMHAFVGCVPIAVAQVLKYHHHPNNYQWELMPNDNNSANTYTWELINDIHAFINEEDTIKYKETGSSVKESFNIATLFTKYFNYTSAVRQSYDRNDADDELFIYRRPFIITGVKPTSGGHSWVCDGAKQWYSCIEMDEGNIAARHLYYHMNWGWDTREPYTNYNGWFSPSNFTVNGNVYSEDLVMTYQIKP